ncbi:muts domain V-domain-containing protein [Aspergillus recurvatus]
MSTIFSRASSFAPIDFAPPSRQTNRTGRPTTTATSVASQDIVCNMSGKSTYIPAITLMAVMAQISSFVPAEYASFPITHQLFARVFTADDMEANVSTFAAEMREMAFILHNINRRSMVIIDELGRGTSTTDGLAIALVLFVTHFHDLATIMAERSGVISLHLASEISPNASKMTIYYRPEQDTAHSVSEELDRLSQRRHSQTKALAIARKQKLILSLREELIHSRNGNMEGQMAAADEDIAGFSQDGNGNELGDEDRSEVMTDENIARYGNVGREDEMHYSSSHEVMDNDNDIDMGEGSKHNSEEQLLENFISQTSQPPGAFLSTS